MIIPGMVSATFKDRGIDDVLAVMGRADLHAIEWSENHHIKAEDIDMARETAAKTADKGIDIVGYGSYYRLGEGMEIRTSLDTASAMGCTQMRIWAGAKASAEVSEELRSDLVQELCQAAEIAGSYGIILNLEWHKNTLTDTNESGLELLRQVDDPWVRTLWQPTQALSFDERSRGLEMISPYLSYLHVYYWDETGRRPFSEGLEHWRRYFSVLDPATVYPALLEFVKDNTEEQFLMDVKALKELIEEI